MGYYGKTPHDKKQAEFNKDSWTLKAHGKTPHQLMIQLIISYNPIFINFITLRQAQDVSKRITLYPRAAIKDQKSLRNWNP